MIDLHAHILAGLDDGPADIETSVAMARTAVADGITRMVAAPHVDDGERRLTPTEMLTAVGDLNLALAREEIPLAVLPGGLLAVAVAVALDDGRLHAFSLGGGGCVLVETPSVETPGLEAAMADVRGRGFRAMLARPERSVPLQQNVDRLHALVGSGVLCAVDAGSLTGRFGDEVRETTIELFRRSLVHAVATDAHDNDQRAPRLSDAFGALETELPDVAAAAAYFTEEAPAAILAGRPLPPLPVARRRPRLRRLFGRRR